MGNTLEARTMPGGEIDGGKPRQTVMISDASSSASAELTKSQNLSLLLELTLILHFWAHFWEPRPWVGGQCGTDTFH